MSDQFEERRIHSRKAFRAKVVFEDEFGDGLFYALSSDFSLGGIHIESELPLLVGTMIFISFALPGHKRPLKASCQVVRIAGGGLGVRFVGLSELATRRLRDFLRK